MPACSPTTNVKVKREEMFGRGSDACQCAGHPLVVATITACNKNANRDWLGGQENPCIHHLRFKDDQAMSTQAKKSLNMQHAHAVRILHQPLQVPIACQRQTIHSLTIDDAVSGTHSCEKCLMQMDAVLDELQAAAILGSSTRFAGCGLKKQPALAPIPPSGTHITISVPQAAYACNSTGCTVHALLCTVRSHTPGTAPSARLHA
jgi:hypothetical protein